MSVTAIVNHNLPQYFEEIVKSYNRSSIFFCLKAKILKTYYYQKAFIDLTVIIPIIFSIIFAKIELFCDIEVRI